MRNSVKLLAACGDGHTRNQCNNVQRAAPETVTFGSRSGPGPIGHELYGMPYCTAYWYRYKGGRTCGIESRRGPGPTGTSTQAEKPTWQAGFPSKASELAVTHSMLCVPSCIAGYRYQRDRHRRLTQPSRIVPLP